MNMSILRLSSSDNVCDVVPGELADCLGFYTKLNSKYKELDSGSWISTISPLNLISIMKIYSLTNSAYLYLKRTKKHDNSPMETIHPGFLFELLYVNDNYSEFVELVSSSDIACKYLDALIAWPGLNDEKLKEAKELMRITLGMV